MFTARATLSLRVQLEREPTWTHATPVRWRVVARVDDGLDVYGSTMSVEESYLGHLLDRAVEDVVGACVDQFTMRLTASLKDAYIDAYLRGAAP